jgi:hypothetical protein
MVLFDKQRKYLQRHGCKDASGLEVVRLEDR